MNSRLLSLVKSQLEIYGLFNASEALTENCLSLGLTLQYIQPSNLLLDLASSSTHDELLKLELQQDILVENPDDLPLEQDDSVDVVGLDFSNSTSNPVSLPDYSCNYTIPHRAPCVTCAFSPDGDLFATGALDSSVKIMQVSKIHDKASADKIVLKTLYDHQGPVNEVAFHPNGQVLASASDDGCIKFYDLTKAQSRRSFRFIQDATAVKTFSFHPSGDFVIVGTNQEHFRIYDIHTLKCFTSQDPNSAHLAPISRVRYSPLGNMFATASQDGTVKIFDTINSKLITSLSTNSPISSINFSKNGKYILSCSKDSIGRLWDVSSSKVMVEYTGASQANGNVTMNFTFNEDLVIGSDENSHAVVLWDARNGTFLKKMLGHSGKLRAFASSPVEDIFVSCGDDNKAKFWNVDNVQ